LSRNGALPSAVPLTIAYGPIALTPGAASVTGEVTVASVARTAADFADRLRDQSWKPLPANAVPSHIAIDGLKLNPGQFLRLMAEAYLDPVPDRKLKLHQHFVQTPAGLMFPRNVSPVDQGNTWTFKPVVLRVLTAAAPQASK
jgi:hypothetical protein